MTYWTPGWPLGFGGDLTAQGANAYGNFPSFDAGGARGGYSVTRYDLPNGWFVGRETGGVGLNLSGISQDGAFGTFRSPYYQGMQFGYNFQSGLPLRVYAGFDTLKYDGGKFDTGIGGPLAPFDTTSGTARGYRAHAGVEFQPAPNLSLSVGVGFTQQSVGSDSDIGSLPASGPAAFGPFDRR